MIDIYYEITLQNTTPVGLELINSVAVLEFTNRIVYNEYQYTASRNIINTYGTVAFLFMSSVLNHSIRKRLTTKSIEGRELSWVFFRFLIQFIFLNYFPCSVHNHHAHCKAAALRLCRVGGAIEIPGEWLIDIAATYSSVRRWITRALNWCKAVNIGNSNRAKNVKRQIQRYENHWRVLKGRLGEIQTLHCISTVAESI